MAYIPAARDLLSALDTTGVALCVVRRSDLRMLWASDAFEKSAAPLMRESSVERAQLREALERQPWEPSTKRVLRIAGVLDAPGWSLSAVPLGDDAVLLRLLEGNVDDGRAGRMDQIRGTLLSVLNHDLRTPLFPVLLTSSMRLGDASLSPQARKDFGLIKRNTETMTAILDEAVFAGRLACGAIAPDMQPVDLHGVFASVLSTQRLEVQAELLTGKSIVAADAGLLADALACVIKFASHAAPDCPLDVTTEEDGDESLRLTVTAVGKRETAAWAESMLQPETAPDRAAAMFLGLASALVEAQGGSVRMSAEPEGIRIIVRMRRSSEQIHAMGPDSGARSRLPSVHDLSDSALLNLGWHSLKVLIVDDDPVTRLMLTRVLEAEGHAVQVAGTVASAIREAQKGFPDVLVSDLSLPDGSGTELVRRLRALGGELAAIAVTGHAAEDQRLPAREAGFLQFFTKPVGAETLRRAVVSAARAMEERLSSVQARG